jgi:hypothetical protein
MNFKFTFAFLVLSILIIFTQPANAANLSLSPSAGNANTGNSFNVDIVLNSSGQSIDGVDAVLSYNPSMLEIQDANSTAAGIQISAGSLMPVVTYNSVNSASGKILFSQVHNPGTTFNGYGTLATITFKALSAGSATVSFDFTAGNTTDSNVAFNGSDVLASVSNGIYSLQGQTVPPSQPPSQPPPGGTPAPVFSCDKLWQCTDWTQCKEKSQTRACSLVTVARFTQSTACPGTANAPYTSMRCITNVTDVKIAESCSDGIRDQDEEGVDCGGVCKPCSITGNATGNATAKPPTPPKNDQPEVNFLAEYVSRFVTYSIVILIVSTLAMFLVLRFKAKKALSAQAQPAKIDKKTIESAGAYVNEARAKGVSEDYIRGYLLQAGWDADVVEEILRKYPKT